MYSQSTSPGALRDSVSDSGRTRPPRWLAVVFVAALATACDSGPDERELLVDSGPVISSDAGAVGDTAFTAIRYEVRSEDYRKWLVAQRALDSIPGIEPPDPIDLRYAEQEEIDAMVARLQDDVRARAAIEGAGMSVREFVMTSVALEQAMAATRPAPRLAFSDIPPANSAIVRENSAELERETAVRRVRIVKDDGGRAGKGGKAKGKAKREKGKRGKG
jgi:hypothetical protein